MGDVMITDYLASTFPLLRKSDSESRRFGRSVYRLTVPENCNWSDTEIITLATSVSADLLIVRAPATRNRLGGALGSHPHLQTLHADSLLYFSRSSIKENADLDLPADLSLAINSPLDEGLTRLIHATFSNYQNHYSANPTLPKDAVEHGYAEWANMIVSSETGVLLTLASDGQPVAFIVVNIFATSANEVQAEISLNGTHPAFRNRGLYRELLRVSLAEVARRGAIRLWISTQASHRVMIRTWEKLGFGFELGLNTYHCSPIGEISSR